MRLEDTKQKILSKAPELAARYVEQVVRYHAGIFRALIAAGEIAAEDPEALYAVCRAGADAHRRLRPAAGTGGRMPAEAPGHVRLFFRMIHSGKQ